MMKFKKFINTLITLVTITIVVFAVIKRLLIHGSDLKNIVLRKHDVMKDIGVKVDQESKPNPEPVLRRRRPQPLVARAIDDCNPHAHYIN